MIRVEDIGTSDASHYFKSGAKLGLAWFGGLVP